MGEILLGGLEEIKKWIGKAETTFITNASILENINSLVRMGHYGDSRFGIKMKEIEEDKAEVDRKKTARLEKIVRM